MTAYDPEHDPERGSDPINAEATDWEAAGLPAQEDDTEDQILPGDEPVAMSEFGPTGTDDEAGESLDTAVSREVPDVTAAFQESEEEGETVTEPGLRLVEEDEGAREDREASLVAEEAGTDQAAMSAEEEAVHTEEEPESI
ncbi:DUF5709 domain-containing protein [Salinactinospora qingdaonensis]|uniref:DUF5709 domain-containing protein n=1 Tax=Salinactinospora qingdaonensis TaxID=702744 RepID=A0ABP7ERU1_9ACTN